MQLGLTQQAAGRPYTRQFMSLVEQGRVVPSLASLLAIARNLETTPGALLDAVDGALGVAGSATPWPADRMGRDRVAAGARSARGRGRRSTPRREPVWREPPR
ncbi:MAG: hypothetical protein A2V85_07920 [Chloroflexi bacterium RBG_16_72_14]|nr:MAG: hypothetical protein A2V85_07920 [Chloroflexi bacterium RBG_16_72_14]